MHTLYPHLLPFLTSEERKREGKQQIFVFLAAMASLILLTAAICLFAAGFKWEISPGWALLALLGSVALGFYAFRTSNRHELYEQELVASAQERLHDELFLRHGVVPKGPLAVELQQTFRTVDGQELQGKVSVSSEGIPTFALMQEGPAAPFA